MSDLAIKSASDAVLEPKIGSLEIQQFRALRQLKIEGLGRVNLITGRNNTGKSSILEALRILASNASISVVLQILRSREEVNDDDGASGLEHANEFPLSGLFHGFPEFPGDLKPIVIAARGANSPMLMSISAEEFVEEEESDGTTRLIPYQQDLIEQHERVSALVIESGEVRRLIRLENLVRLSPRRFEFAEVLFPCVFVTPYGGERTATLGRLWDKIALTDREGDVVDALRIIDTKISAVSMVGGEGPRRLRTAIVRSDGIPRPIPLRSYGDGLNRLFGIILSLVNAQGGLLLIDEFENGLHYTVQTDVWRAIFRLASALDVQVVATSHSRDAVEAFQKAASEVPDRGVLVKLSRAGDRIVPTVFSEQELAIITRDQIEVR